MKGLLLVLLLLSGAWSAWGGEPQDAVRGYVFSFPKDHRPHRGYKTEWWYYTGHLLGPEVRLGFQFTIFKLERENGTAFLFHCALTEPQGFRFDEKLQREFPGLAGERDGGIWVEDNRLLIEGNRHRLVSHCQGAKLELDLRHDREPVIHGEEGFSPKGENPKNGTHYYSVVDLGGKAVLETEGGRQELEAQVWMDHEFGSNFLEPRQKGWDWLTLDLDSGDKMMLFRIRQEPGPDFYWGTFIPKTGPARTYRRFTLAPQGTWKSRASGVSYPAGFKVSAPEGSLTLTPWYADQELRTPLAGMVYFEGAVEVQGDWLGSPVKGLGYLELTGYAGPVQGRF